jgi:DNA polymerase III subunit beta
MQATVAADALAGALEDVKASLSTHPTLPVFSAVRLTASDGVITVAATDLELTTLVTAPAEVTSPGEAVVPFALFSTVFKAMLGRRPARARRRPPDAERCVRLAVADGHLQLRMDEAGDFWHDLRLLDAAEYPALPTVRRGRVAVVSGPALRQAVTRVATAASTDAARPVLTGIFFEPGLDTATLAATDSYRLAVHDLPLTWRTGGTAVRRELRERRVRYLPGVLIPCRAMSHAVKLLGDVDEVAVALNGDLVAFAAAGRQVVARRIEGEFPKYRTLIPAAGNRATVERTRLERALAQMAPYCPKNNPVRAAFAPTTLELTGNLQDAGRGGGQVPVSYEGEAVTTGFNLAYLQAGVTVIDDPDLVLRVLDGLKPMVLQGAGDPAFTYLLMPVKLAA